MLRESRLKAGLRTFSNWVMIKLCTFLLILMLTSACVPLAERSDDCNKSRDVVKQFYSIHFDGDMNFTNESLAPKLRFLSPELAALLQKKLVPGENANIKGDVFTGTTEFPKSFRISDCKSSGDSPPKAMVEVKLIWKTEEKSDEKFINVETVKIGDNWLINNILLNKSQNGEQ
jgi:hypothetical protein